MNMSTTENNYVKLPGVGHQIGSYTRLYRGGDHLLQVSSVTFSENYKRFFYRDIQAFTIVRTQTWFIIIGLMALAALVFTAAGLGAGDDVGSIVLGSLAALFLLLGLIVALRGPSCDCYVRTAVQTEKLPSLNRVRRAEKILAGLAPLIAAAQGPMPAAEPGANAEVSGAATATESPAS
jgi:hypothetical protein